MHGTHDVDDAIFRCQSIILKENILRGRASLLCNGNVYKDSTSLLDNLKKKSSFFLYTFSIKTSACCQIFVKCMCVCLLTNFPKVFFSTKQKADFD